MASGDWPGVELADGVAPLCSRGRAPCRSRRAPRCASARRPPAAPMTSGSGCPSGRCGRTCARRRRSAATSKTLCEPASRRRRPCPPGTPRSSAARASGSAWRSRSRRWTCPRAASGCRRRSPASWPLRLQGLQLRADVRLVDVAERRQSRRSARPARRSRGCRHGRRNRPRPPDGLVRARQSTNGRAAGQHRRTHQEMSSIHGFTFLGKGPAPFRMSRADSATKPRKAVSFQLSGGAPAGGLDGVDNAREIGRLGDAAQSELAGDLRGGSKKAVTQTTGISLNRR